MSHWDNQELILVTGKGGVGKSTCAAGIALGLAQQGKKTLLVDLAARPSIRDMFSVPTTAREPIAPITSTPTFYALHIKMEDAIRDYFSESLPVGRLVDIATNNSVRDRLWKAAPSFNEVVVWSAVLHYVRGTHPRAKMQFDHVVVDMPASGHAVTMLGVPQGITKIARLGNIAERARELVELFTNSSRTAMVVVTLRDELPVNETIQLRERLDAEVGVKVTHVVLNQVFERPWPESDDHEWLHLQKHVSGHAVLGPWLQQRCRWSDRQATHEARLRETASDVRFISISEHMDRGEALATSIADNLTQPRGEDA